MLSAPHRDADNHLAEAADEGADHLEADEEEVVPVPEEGRSPSESRSSIFPNMLTRRSGSSSREGGKVRLVSSRLACSSLVLLRSEQSLMACSLCVGDGSVIGTLKGYDQLLNLVLDEVEEEVLRSSSIPLAPPTGLCWSRSRLTYRPFLCLVPWFIRPD
jgi:hypothetical protein